MAHLFYGGNEIINNIKREFRISKNKIFGQVDGPRKSYIVIYLGIANK